MINNTVLVSGVQQSYIYIYIYTFLFFSSGFPGGLDGKASLLAQSVKTLPAVQEAWVRFLDRKDPLKKEMATHSSILA